MLPIYQILGFLHAKAQNIKDKHYRPLKTQHKLNFMDYKTLFQIHYREMPKFVLYEFSFDLKVKAKHKSSRYIDYRAFNI